MVPLRKCSFVRREDGTVEVFVPRYGEGRVGRFLGRFLRNEPVRLKLDEIGTLTWELCDGSHPVLTIADRLRERFGEEVEPVYDRLAVFFMQMEKREMIEWKVG